jgi:glycosyltransferase involved in cell wall biosynthesis
MPKISVIIPTRDRPDLLTRAIMSVRRQSFHDIELIVVDDGSGDGARAAHAFDFCPVVTLATGGAGQVPARNMGVRAAGGAYIAFLDDDDWWDDASHLAGLLASFRGEGLAYASGRIVSERPGEPDESLPFPAHADAQSLRRDNKLLIPGIAYDRVLHGRLGPFDEGLPYYWDWDWYLRIAAAGLPFFRSDGEGVCISARRDSVSAAANEAARRADLDRLCAKHGLTGIVLKNHESIAREQSGDFSNKGGGAAQV